MMNRILILSMIFICTLIYCVTLHGVYATTTGNIKYEPAVERITISCVDHQAPRVRVVGDTVVVVDCERQK